MLVAALAGVVSCERETVVPTQPSDEGPARPSDGGPAVRLGEAIVGDGSVLYFAVFQRTGPGTSGVFRVWRYDTSAGCVVLRESERRVWGIAQVADPSKVCILEGDSHGSQLVVLTHGGVVVGLHTGLPPLAALAAGRSTSDILAMRTGEEGYTNTLLLGLRDDGSFRTLLDLHQRPFRLVWMPTGELCQVRLSTDRRETELDMIDMTTLSARHQGTLAGVVWDATALPGGSPLRLLVMRSDGPPGHVRDHLSIADLSTLALDDVVALPHGMRLFSPTPSGDGRYAACVREQEGQRELVLVDLQTREVRVLSGSRSVTKLRFVGNSLLCFEQTSQAVSLWQYSLDGSGRTRLWMTELVSLGGKE